jgi:uncharacterized membrane protein YfcA
VETKIFFIMPLAFVCEYIDSTLGMGYGTTLTPVLLLMGFSPLQVVPAVLFSEFVSGLIAAAFHHSVRNASFRPGSQDTKVATVLSTFAVIGAVISVVVALRLPADILKIWIGVIVVAMGVAILALRGRRCSFSWSRISLLGALASFNKGMSGGGYGPLVMGGQVLSGVGVKNAVAITSFSEGVTCLVGVTMYFFLRTQSESDWILAPWLMAGAILSVPLAAHTVKRISEDKMKAASAIVIIALGVLTLSKVIF